MRRPPTGEPSHANVLLRSGDGVSVFLGVGPELRADGETKKTQEMPKAQSETIQVQDVPKVVVDAVKTKFPDAQMQKAKKKVVMETPSSARPHEQGDREQRPHDPQRQDRRAQEGIPASELPAKVAEAVYASYPNSTTKKAEKGHRVQGREELQTGSDHF